jgi:hypothetical protein
MTSTPARCATLTEKVLVNAAGVCFTAETPRQSPHPNMDFLLNGRCAQITRRRRKLQLAIDAEYPPGPPLAFRKQFGLQGNKAMS